MLEIYSKFGFTGEYGSLIIFGHAPPILVPFQPISIYLTVKFLEFPVDTETLLVSVLVIYIYLKHNDLIIEWTGKERNAI